MYLAYFRTSAGNVTERSVCENGEKRNEFCSKFGFFSFVVLSSFLQTIKSAPRDRLLTFFTRRLQTAASRTCWDT
jgi:hypothetical protein